jgi:hypothetical protein
MRSSLDDVTYVTFRRFPISAATIDQSPLRALTFAVKGVTIETERGRYNRSWSDLPRFDAQEIGSGPRALALTLYTKDGAFGGEMLGVVEISCWGRIREAIKRIAPPVSVTGWIPPEIPPHRDLSDLDRAMKMTVEGRSLKEGQQ